MKYLPKSKKGRAFLATIISTSAYYIYDYMESEKVKLEIQNNLKEFGLKVIQPQDQLDKVKIFIAPSYYAMNWFNSYYRPYLYVGGMDYDLEQKELDANLLLDVAKVTRDSRKKWTIKQESIRSRTWLEYFMGKKVETRKTLNVEREFKGIIGIGPEVYDKVKLGYDHGLKCLKEECDQECFKDENIKDMSSNLDIIGNEMDYPRLFKMPGKEQTGWSGFPKRIFWAFHQRWILKETGDELLKVFREIEDLS